MSYETHSMCVHFSCPAAVRTQSWCAPSPHGHNSLVVVLVVKHYGHNNICIRSGGAKSEFLRFWTKMVDNYVQNSRHRQGPIPQIQRRSGAKSNLRRQIWKKLLKFSAGARIQRRSMCPFDPLESPFNQLDSYFNITNLIVSDLNLNVIGVFQRIIAMDIIWDDD